MRRNRKIALLAGAGAALAIAGGAAAAVAATDAFSPEEASKAVIDDAAEQLGVEPDELSDALRDALKNRVDEALEAGRLTQDQASALKERIDSADAPLVFGGLGRTHGFGPHGPGLHEVAGLDAAAAYLGLTEAELRTALGAGKSLAEIARDEGKSVDGLVEDLVADASKRLDRAVEDGKLTRQRADEIEGRLEERIRDLVAREPGTHRFPGPGFGPGFHRSDGGLPSVRGPHA